MGDADEQLMESLNEEEKRLVDTAPTEELRKFVLQSIRKKKAKRAREIRSRLNKNSNNHNTNSNNGSSQSTATPKRTRGSGSTPPQSEEAKKMRKSSPRGASQALPQATTSSQATTSQASNHSATTQEPSLVNSEMNYREASTCVRVILTFDNYPLRFFSKNQARTLEFKLLNLIRKPTESATKPTFSNIRFHEGTVMVLCRDRFTADWLENISFETTVDDQKISFYHADSLPEPPRFRFWLWGEALNFEMIRSLIQNQNEGLRTQYWHFVHRHDTELGQAIYLSVDFVSANRLKEMNYKVACGFRMVTFAPLLNDKKSEPPTEPNESNEVEPDNSEDILLLTDVEAETNIDLK